MASPAPRPGSTPVAPRRHAAARRRRWHIRTDLPVAIGGLVLVIGGSILQLIAIVSATWLDATVGKKSITLDFAGFNARTQRGLAFMYFSWGAWVLLLLTLVLGLAACVHWRGAHPFRVAGGLVGVAGAFVTIAAVLVFAYQSDADVFKVARNYSSGVYLAVLGLLATALGAAAGGAGR